MFFWASCVEFRSHFTTRLKHNGTRGIHNTQGDQVGDLEKAFEGATEDEGELVVIGSIRMAIIELEPLLMVLHIVDRDGIKERINIGQIQENAWIEARPAIKLIVLG